MNKKILIIISILLIVILALVTIFIIDHNRMKNNEPVIFSTWGENYNSKKENNITENMNVVLSLEDEISENSVWCGTFNLIWNDLKNNLAKQDIIFTPQIKLVENLNKGTFTKEYLSEESYYTVYDKASLELKEKIEKDIKEKFNETSDILNDFDWENVRPEDYFLYAMLKKEFEFPKEFTQLENGNFGEFKNVEFFGVNNTTENEVKEQIEVLYYNTKDDFAIKLLTKNNDEIIITKGSNEKTFGEMYSEIIKKSENYEGSKSFGENDTLKIPNISFNIKKEFKELENQIFEFSTGDNYYIEKALQTIQFELNKKGGKLKSEAGMMVNRSSIVIEEPRQFFVDSEFAIFLKEKDKNLPYFASTISDISCIQENVEKEEINLKKEDNKL